MCPVPGSHGTSIDPPQQACAVGPIEEAPVASAMMILNEHGMPRYGHDAQP